MTVIRRLLAVLAIFATVLSLAPTSAAASATAYVVEPGDFLLGIAREHDVSLGSLLRANDLSADSVIYPGQRLTLPAGATTPITGSPTASTSSGGAPGSTYTVVAGDALSTIAARHGVRLSALLQLNGLGLTSVIMPGQQIEIPAGGSAPAAAAPQAAAPSSGGSGSTYTVVAGDALSTIAARHGVRLSALLELNVLSLTSVIMPGQQIELPAGATPAAAPTSSTPTPTSTPSGSNSRIDAVVNYARAQVGKPYQFFTKGPDTFDCSGLTLAAYAQAGISLIHFSAAQAVQGSPVDFHNEAIRPGDLVFQKRRGSESINHVGIAVSSTTWIQATGPGDAVRIGSLPAKSTIDKVRRYIDA